MESLIKKLTYASLGFISLGRKKAQELAEEISEKTNLSEEEGKKLVDDLSIESDKLKEELDHRVKEQVEKTLHKLNIPTREEIDKLEGRIRQLEASGNEQGSNDQ